MYAKGRFVALHGAQDGPVVVATGSGGPVRDGLSGAVVGTGPKLTLPLKRGETRVLEFNPVPAVNGRWSQGP